MRCLQPATPLAATLLATLAFACSGSVVEVTEASEPAGGVRAAGVDSGIEPLRRESADGLVVSILTIGEGRRAALGSTVLLHYRGQLAETDAEIFSTWTHGIPEELVLGQRRLIPGLERALLGMRAGTRAEIDVPSALAYGDVGLGDIPAGANLRFELELVSVR